MYDSEKTWGWDLATHHDLLKKTLGGYSSFHDSAVRSFCMIRSRTTRYGSDNQLLPGTRTRDLVDVRLELLHNRYGPQTTDRRQDCVVVIDCLDVRTADIDVNAMLEEATVMEMTLARDADGSIRLDLLPNVGLDVRLTCAQVVVSDIYAYDRDNP